MDDIAIKFENISKQYRLGTIGTGTISHDLNRWWSRVRGKEDPYLKIGSVNDGSTKADRAYVWALREISLEVKKGDLLGIIGKNGAGKSTLLKILSRVTTPSTGVIRVKGRIAALLEVGTGFHPEMTGRENVFMNGSIMGMTKLEIKNKLDEIVDFAGIEKYIDTPVKRFSSGMMVRLGFAIAAHLEPEILVVDEVLAVGDTEFQKKAIGKMKDVSGKSGRTVLFVSHNMAAVRSLCQTGIFLEHGEIIFNGNVEDCVAKYLKGSNNLPNHKKWNGIPEIKNEDFELIEIGIKGAGLNYEDIIRIDQPLEFSAIFKKKSENKRIDITIHLKDEYGNRIFSTGSGSIFEHFNSSRGEYLTSVVFPPNFFNWGNLYFDLFVVEDRKRVLMVVNDILSVTLSNIEMQPGVWMGREPGAIKPSFNWVQKKI